MYRPGLEVFLSQKHKGKKRIALVCNNTSRDRHGRHLVDLIKAKHSEFNLIRVFTPEHGFSSAEPDGEHVNSFYHKEFQIEVVSLYGKLKKPTPDLLSDLDLLIYDIQDVGVRFYTYISTLRNILDAANEVSLPVAVLDRPDPIGGFYVEGPMLEPSFESFVGNLPVPLRYGLTPAELALWWKSHNKLSLEIKIFASEDYTCPSDFDSLGFPWHKPSPSMPNSSTAIFYQGTCLFEGTQISEGRGTQLPFRQFGAPQIDSKKWLDCFLDFSPADIRAEQTSFIPTFSKYAGIECHGIKLSTNKKLLKTALSPALLLLHSLMLSHPTLVDFTMRPSLQHPFFDYLCGTDKIRKSLQKGENPHSILRTIEKEASLFSKQREKFFIYERKQIEA